MRRIKNQRTKAGKSKATIIVFYAIIGVILGLIILAAINGISNSRKKNAIETQDSRSETDASKSEYGETTATTTETSATSTTSATTTETSEATTTTTETSIEFTFPSETLSTVVDSNRDELGSGAELSGKILVVTIFTSDLKGSWDLSEKHDKDLRQTVWNDLDIATEFIEDSAADYGRYVEFIWDFEKNKDLEYEAELSIDAFETLYSPSYTPFYETIDGLVPTDELMKKYGANGIVYFMFFDDEFQEDRRSCSRPYYGHPKYNYEVSFINMNRSFWETRPSSVAHEMLHLFGAPDLYFANSHDLGITQEYVDYAAESNLNDIMRIVSDPETGVEYADRIVNKITDITAYYVGLTDYSETVDKWGFNASEHAA